MNDTIDLPIHIDLKVVQRTIRTAINEAGIYAGFTYNVKIDNNFINYALVEDSKIQFVPVTNDVKIIQEYKEYFYDWVIKNSFKYVVDRFSIYLDEIYYVCLLSNSHKSRYSKELIDSIESKKVAFHKKNFLKKLAMLKSEFDISPRKAAALLSIQSARNCLTHRSGIIGNADLKNNSEFIVKWSGYHIYAKDDSGVEIDLNTIPSEGVLLPKGGNIMLKQHADKQRIFRLDEKIRFSSKEFAEILLYLQAEADHILNGTEKFLEKMGIPKVG